MTTPVYFHTDVRGKPQFDDLGRIASVLTNTIEASVKSNGGQPNNILISAAITDTKNVMEIAFDAVEADAAAMSQIDALSGSFEQNNIPFTKNPGTYSETVGQEIPMVILSANITNADFPGVIEAVNSTLHPSVPKIELSSLQCPTAQHQR